MAHASHFQTYTSKPWLKNYAQGVRHSIGDVPYSSLPDLIQKSAMRFQHKPAFTCVLDNGMSATLTYGQIDALSSAFAAYLREELKLNRGDRVAVQLPNCLAFPVVTFGVLKAGCVLVNTNPLYTEREMEHQFLDSGARVLVIIDLCADKLATILPKTRVETVVRVSVADLFVLPLRLLIKTVLKLQKKVPTPPVYTTDLSTALALGAAKNAPIKDWIKEYSANELAALQYTGGTTGVAKGAMLSHGNLLANTLQVFHYAGPYIEVGKETIMTVFPLYHIFAFTVNLLTFFTAGAHNILIPNPRPLINIRKAFAKYEISWLTGVNTLFNGLADEPWFKSQHHHFKMSIAGGAALLKAVGEKWRKVTNTPILEGYGLTESSPVLAFNPLGGQVKEECIGLPLPDTILACVNDNGDAVPPGEAGELVMQGPQMMMGYWGQPAETAQVIRDGWLYTGDVAVMDDGGYFKIVDRKKDIILVSGFNVYPNEVEAVIAQHPDVAEVAVVGVASDGSGEAVKAFVVSKRPGLTEELVKEHCKRLLTAYKVPKIIEFRKELPKSTVGKILRKELRTKR